MKNKRNLLVLVSACLLFGVTSCGNNENGGETPIEHTHTFETAWTFDKTSHWHKSTCEHVDVISDKAEHTLVDGKCSVCDYSKEILTITYEGEAEVGGDITLIVKNSKGEEVKGVAFQVVEGAEKVSILSKFVTLLEAGNVTIVVETEDYYGKLSFTITEKQETVYSIRQVKTMVSMLENQMVTIYGKVTASLGNSFFVGDGNQGMYVYNMNSLYSSSDAFVNGIIPLGKTVKVRGLLTNSTYGLQLNGYDGQYLSDAYVRNYETTEIEEITPVVISTEEELKELMTTPNRAGESIRITGEYISGDLSNLYNEKNAFINMKIGNTEFSLKADKYDINSSKIYTTWANANAEQGDILTVDSVFTYYNKKDINVAFAGLGTSINNDSKDETKLRLDVKEKFVGVNKTITLNALVPSGVTGEVTYEVISGTEFATISGNVLTGVKEGTCKVVAKIGELVSYPVSIQVIAAETQKIGDVLKAEKGSSVEVEALLTGVADSGFIISDETGSIYVHTNKNAIYDEKEFNGKIGTMVKVTGTVDIYEKNGLKQIVNYTIENLDTTGEYPFKYTDKTLKDVLTLTDEELTYLVPVHISNCEGYTDNSNNFIITSPDLGDAVLFSLDTTMWNSMAFSGEADGFIAGKTIYEGVTEYFFYFSNPMPSF